MRAREGCLRMTKAASASWARHSAMAALPRVAQHREWLQTNDFTRYGIDWVRGNGMGGRSVGVDQVTFSRAVAEQWFRPLTILSTSATAALRSAATSLANEVLPPLFSYDIPSEGLAFLPSTLRGNSDQGAFGVSVLAWSHCYIGEAPGIFVTSWVSDDFGEDPDVSDMRFSNALQGRTEAILPRYLLKHAEPLVCGREATYGHAVHNPHREETVPIGMADPDPHSLTHRLLYALWSMLSAGALVESKEVPLPPRTSTLYAGERVHGMSVPGVKDNESLLTVRKDRVEDFYDERNLFVWNVASPQGGRIV